MRIIRCLLILAVFAGLAFYWLAYWPLRDKHPATRPTRGVLVIAGARIYKRPRIYTAGSPQIHPMVFLFM
jgi:hypothetical protein